jgi:hypothetical protein
MGRLAWATPVLTAALVGVTFALKPPEDSDGVAILFGLAFLAYPTVGALIVSRHHRHPVGWLFCAVGVLSTLAEALYAYGHTSPERPAAAAGAWLGIWLGQPVTVLIVLLLLLFPTGRFPSRRWRRLGTAAVAAGGVWTLAAALGPGPLREGRRVENPLAVESLEPMLGPIADLGAVALLLLVVAGIACVVARYRGGSARERRQLKWLALAAAVATWALLAVVAITLTTDTDAGIMDDVTAAILACALASFPVAAGVAILRDRLFDIDVVINRALVYGGLSTGLAATYLALVLVLQLALSPVTRDSGLAIAASTLAVAALFRPARGRIQAAVDRRFYRSRYDAARTLEAFSARLRDQVDLAAVSADLRGVVRDTVQPAHVSLWLRERTP